ncbi:Alkali-sensitive linkage protein 1, partial [Durusdinium trenchii]
AMGVNVFGFDGFDNADAVKRAVRVLFQKGVRHFRVVNVGAWASDALLAIEEMAKLE